MGGWLDHGYFQSFRAKWTPHPAWALDPVFARACWPVLSTIHAFCSPTKDSPSRPLGVAILVPPHPNTPPPPGLPSIRLPGNDKWSQKDVMKMGESPQHVFGLLHNQSVLT